LDKSAEFAGITRENYISNIVMRGIPGENLLFWEESRSYTLICPSMQGIHPFSVDLFFRADPGNLESLLSRANQQVLIDGKSVFEFGQWFEAVDKKIPDVRKPIEGKGGSLSFDGSWVTFNYSAKIALSKIRTDVQVLERSYLQQVERSYTLRISQPVRRFDFSLALGQNLDGWCLRTPILSAAEYDTSARTQQVGEQHVTASVQGWVLPGVVLAVEWTPPGGVTT
jgi:hypothetical protein